MPARRSPTGPPSTARSRSSAGARALQLERLRPERGERGAIAGVIIDALPEPRTNFGGAAAIPSVAVGAADGQLIVDTLALPQVVNATLEDNPDHQINRDGDLDAGVIVHEYGHGISNRLTGGPATAGCLGNAEQMEARMERLAGAVPHGFRE
ncbi:MAG: M36 family metallopeptidase [Thermoanaerobaculia bacterium]